MTKLQPVKYKRLDKVAEAVGFSQAGRKGSHIAYRNSEGRVIIIPHCGSQKIVIELLRKIIRDMGISVDEYHALIDRI